MSEFGKQDKIRISPWKIGAACIVAVVATNSLNSCETNGAVEVGSATVTAEFGDTATGIVCDTSTMLAERAGIDPRRVQGCVEAGQSVGGLWPGDGIRVSLSEKDRALGSSYLVTAERS